MKTACFIDTSLEILIERCVQTLLIVILHKIKRDLDWTVTNVSEGALTDFLKAVSSQIVHLMRIFISSELNVWRSLSLSFVIIHQKIIGYGEFKWRRCFLSIWSHESHRFNWQCEIKRLFQIVSGIKYLELALRLLSNHAGFFICLTWVCSLLDFHRNQRDKGLCNDFCVKHQIYFTFKTYVIQQAFKRKVCEPTCYKVDRVPKRIFALISFLIVLT